MKLTKQTTIVLITLLTLTLSIAGYFLGRYQSGESHSQPDKKAGHTQHTPQSQGKKSHTKPTKPSQTPKIKSFSISKHSQNIMGLRTEKVRSGRAETLLDFTGKLAYNRDTLSYITTKQSGIVKRIYKTIGDHVGTGDSLLRIESNQLGKAQQNYLNSKALYREARRNYQRAQTLYEKRIISENQYLKERSNYRVHHHHVQNAISELKVLGFEDIHRLASSHSINPNISLVSPLSGRIIERYANLGEMVTPAKPAYKIANLASLWLYLDVYEKDFRHFKAGQKLHFTPVSYPDKDFHATVDYLNSEVTGASRTIKVRAVVSNASGHLLPNMFVRAKLKVLVGEKRLMLPSSALIYTGKRYIVFVSPGKGKFIPRVVRPGQQIGDYTIVHSGVQEGESVVVSANFLLDSEAQGKGYFREPGESSTIGSHKH